MCAKHSQNGLVLVSRNCRWCEGYFYICKSCNRGHKYCGPLCRALSKKKQQAEAGARFDKTPNGRTSKKNRQSASRKRTPEERASSPQGIVANRAKHNSKTVVVTEPASQKTPPQDLKKDDVSQFQSEF
jgi:hypothetical protein